MDAHAAVDFINNRVLFWPDWKFHAEDYSLPPFIEDLIFLTVEYRPHETNREDAMAFDKIGTSVPVLHLNPSRPLDVSDIEDHNELLFALGAIVIELQTHEMREALRVRPTYEAPFHPHREEGEENWNAMMERVREKIEV